MPAKAADRGAEFMNARSRTVRAAAAIGSVGLMVTAAGQARSAEDGQKFSDWTVKCRDHDSGTGPMCVLTQILKRKNGEETQRMMSTVVGRFGPNAEPGMLISVPLGVFLPAGSVIEVEGRTDSKRLDFQFCSRAGCRVILKLDRQWLDLFRAGTRASVTVNDRRRRPVKMPLSLNGFTKGTEAIGIQ